VQFDATFDKIRESLKKRAAIKGGRGAAGRGGQPAAAASGGGVDSEDSEEGEAEAGPGGDEESKGGEAQPPTPAPSSATKVLLHRDFVCSCAKGGLPQRMWLPLFTLVCVYLCH
jgi:hypothetical protein